MNKSEKTSDLSFLGFRHFHVIRLDQQNRDLEAATVTPVLLKTEKDFCHRKEFSGTEKDFYLPFLYNKTYVLELLI